MSVVDEVEMGEIDCEREMWAPVETVLTPRWE